MPVLLNVLSGVFGSRRLRPGVLVLVAVLGLPSTAVGQNQDNDVTPEQVAAVKAQIHKIDRWLKKAEQDRSQLQQSLANTEQAINQLTRERRDLASKSDAQEQRLAQLRQHEADVRKTLDSQRDSLRKQIRHAWMQGDTPAVKVLLNEINPGKIARTMTYYEYLSQESVDRLKAFQASLTELQQVQDKVLASRAELTRLQDQVAKRQQALADRKQEREQTLAALRADIRDRQSERKSLVADRERLEKLLQAVEQAIASIPSPNDSQPFKSLRAQLPWPAHGKVSRHFGESLAHGKLRQNGILISTKNDADVSAVHHGRVVFANWLRGFGLMAIIDHGDGYMSLYGHNSSLLVNPGDWVTTGQPIAIAGRSGGSETPGVYFEIRHRGKPQNPEKWLTH